MLRYRPQLDHQKPKLLCRNCKATMVKPIIFCGDCWRIGAEGVAVGGFVVGGLVAALKAFGVL